MPKKTLYIALVVAGAVSVGTLGYLAGFKSSSAGTSPPPRQEGGSGEETPHRQGEEVFKQGTETTTQVEDSPIIANGVGNISGERGSSEARQAFLAASERRSPAEAGGEGRDATEPLEEDSLTSDGDIAELAGRLGAIEQAFALDNRRSRSRMGGDGGEGIAELKETVSNLYDIVGGLPSLDTLETKMAGVDGAIEEMNATMERLVELGNRMEALEKEKGGEEKVAETARKAQEELVRVAETAQKVQDDLAQVTETAKGASEGVNALRSEVEKNTAGVTASTEGAARFERQVSSAEAAVEAAKEAVAGVRKEAGADRGRLDSLSAQISVMDKNLRSVVEGYKKVYENAARTEKRFVSIEAFLGDIETRLGAVEANFGPAQQ